MYTIPWALSDFLRPGWGLLTPGLPTGVLWRPPVAREEGGCGFRPSWFLLTLGVHSYLTGKPGYLVTGVRLDGVSLQAIIDHRGLVKKHREGQVVCFGYD